VVPTRVGVNRSTDLPASPFPGGPHTRGGEPPLPENYIVAVAWSPHAWG